MALQWCLQNKATRHLVDYCFPVSDVAIRQHLRSDSRHVSKTRPYNANFCWRLSHIWFLIAYKNRQSEKRKPNFKISWTRNVPHWHLLTQCHNLIANSETFVQIFTVHLTKTQCCSALAIARPFNYCYIRSMTYPIWGNQIPSRILFIMTAIVICSLGHERHTLTALPGFTQPPILRGTVKCL